MPNTYPKTLLVAQSKYQYILDPFAESLYPTIRDKNIDVILIHENLNLPSWMTSYNVPYYGARAINECFAPNQRKYQVFGLINDDYLFRPEWFDDVLEKMRTYTCVSSGYVESHNTAKLDVAYEKTKNEEGIIDGIFGSAFFFPAKLMRRIGLLDVNAEDWDDIDWYWRIKINGFTGVTSKKITTLHYGALTRKKQSHAEWKIHFDRELKGKEDFIKKHGYESFRFLKNIYKGHSYFKQFK